MFGKRTFIIVAFAPIYILILLNLLSTHILSVFEYFTEDLNYASHPYIGLNISEIVEADGYPFEAHEITTEDGFILTYFRVPFGKENKATNRTPVLIHHGFASSAVDFFMLGTEKSLPYKLADRGYDVWVANCRGNPYSKKHVNLDTNSKEFWNYSFDEIGRFDLPAAIDYILKTTKQPKLTYIGHSMGCNVFFVAMSENPDLNSKVNLMVAFGPSVYTQDATHPIRNLLPSANTQAKVKEYLFGSYEFTPSIFIHLFSVLGRTICAESSTSYFKDFCINLIKQQGVVDGIIDKNLVPLIFQFNPSQVSMKVYQHYSQLHLSAEYKNYDYGTEENIKKYGQNKPPFYNLDNVKVPIAIYHANNEVYFSYKNLQKLTNQLPNVIEIFTIKRPDFSHVDFNWANDAPSLVFDEVLNFMKNY